MAVLTTDELSRIKKNQKLSSKLPILFEGDSEGSTTISRLLEAHLILQSDANKRKALEWITTVYHIKFCSILFFIR